MPSRRAGPDQIDQNTPEPTGGLVYVSVAARAFGNESDSPSYRMAIGLPGEPVAPFSRSGENTKANW
jgi:hypothetical protein